MRDLQMRESERVKETGLFWKFEKKFSSQFPKIQK
jgi:hypothetical protein